jgi:2-polyprenyl-6-methoxyphenol hydroxylase-like FAD-dependent oxidoreductase
MKALIAGGGIGGLAVGIALRQAGLEVQVFERSRELREIGAGLMIWPNGTRALQALGVEARALTVQQIYLRHWRGRHLMTIPAGTISERYGSEVAFVHRADLQAALARSFGRYGLHLGADVCAFNEEAPECKPTSAMARPLRGTCS